MGAAMTATGVKANSEAVGRAAQDDNKQPWVHTGRQQSTYDDDEDDQSVSSSRDQVALCGDMEAVGRHMMTTINRERLQPVRAFSNAPSVICSQPASWYCEKVLCGDTVWYSVS